MCDYSLDAFAYRPAKVGDKLITKDFGTYTRGFASADDSSGVDAVAVCMLPGTELAFDKPIENLLGSKKSPTTKVARFTQINKEQVYAHHDALELPEGDVVLVTHLREGQTATVLQLPAQQEPKFLAEVGTEVPKSLEVVGI